MNINLANIDFAAGQGGGGEAVIRELNVTENGTYRAPSGVDGYNPVDVRVASGGSLTPEEQAALDTLVDASGGVLYTEAYDRYRMTKVYMQNDVNSNSASDVFWDDLYIIDGDDLYKLNRETYRFDLINSFGGMWGGPIFFGDKSGRLYWNGYELDLENGTLGQDMITLPGVQRYGSLQNIFYGEYGVWILSSDAYKFNESSQEFEQMTLNNTFGYGGASVFLNMFKYDGHILGLYNSFTFEVTEYEDHIDVADVTGVYFNMPSFGVDSYCFKSTKDGDLYYVAGYSVYKYNELSGVWEDIQIKNMTYPIEGYATLVSDNLMFSIYNGKLFYTNLGEDFNNTSWTNVSNVAVDLESNQEISGNKTFTGTVRSKGNLYVDYVYSNNNMVISTGSNSIKIVGNNIVISDERSNNTIIKNGTKHIATVDQTFVNSTFIPFGNDGDNIGYVNGDNQIYYNFNTYTNRMFKKSGSDWYEFDGTSTLIPVSFGFEFGGQDVYNSPTMTIVIAYDQVSTYNTYMWNDANTRWDLICSSNQVSSSVWFDGDNFRCGDTYKLEETGGVWSWVSDPLVNSIWQYYYKFGYKNGEVYAYNDNDWHLYKYNKLNCTMDKIGFVNAGSGFFSYFDEMFFKMNDGNVYTVDLSKVDPQNPDEYILSDSKLFKPTNAYSAFIGATDRLWYYSDSGEMCSSYEYIYETPEVPASNGTYVLQATRNGDQITYEWVSNVI